MSHNLIEVRNLTKRLGNKIALREISLDVRPGEFWGLVGPTVQERRHS